MRLCYASFASLVRVVWIASSTVCLFVCLFVCLLFVCLLLYEVRAVAALAPLECPMLLIASCCAFRPPPSAMLSAARSHNAIMCDNAGAITDIASFMQQVRATKQAIRNALAAEGGSISEDMSVVIEGLSSVNPTAPNPAADIDLWAGEIHWHGWRRRTVHTVSGSPCVVQVSSSC